MDILDNVATVIGFLRQTADPEWDPTDISSNRLSQNEIVIYYRSKIKICAFTRGVIKGIAQCKKEKIAVTETKCMLNGDDLCEYLIRME